jgi:hypothetical protein
MRGMESSRCSIKNKVAAAAAAGIFCLPGFCGVM